MSEPLLSVRDLVVRFATEQGELTALAGVSFDVPKASTLALVGESGCGKSVTALSILRLLPSAAARIDGGTIRFEGRDLLRLAPRELCALRGARISMVFQDPLAALHPLYSVGAQLCEAFRLHLPIGRAEARRRALELHAARWLPGARHDASGTIRTNFRAACGSES